MGSTPKKHMIYFFLNSERRTTKSMFTTVIVLHQLAKMGVDKQTNK
jgi:hypothetical protein